MNAITSHDAKRKVVSMSLMAIMMYLHFQVPILELLFNTGRRYVTDKVIWYNPNNKYSLQPRAIYTHREYYRIVSGQLLHGNTLHLFLNMSSFMSLMGTEKRMYSLPYFILMVVLFPLTSYCMNVLVMKLDPAKKYSYTVGFSGIIFALKTFDNAFANGTTTIGVPFFADLYRFDVPIPVPRCIAHFCELFIVSILFPSASFWGHAGGIAAGYIVAITGFLVEYVIVGVVLFFVICGLQQSLNSKKEVSGSEVVEKSNASTVDNDKNDDIGKDPSLNDRPDGMLEKLTSLMNSVRPAMLQFLAELATISVQLFPQDRQSTQSSKNPKETSYERKIGGGNAEQLAEVESTDTSTYLVAKKSRSDENQSEKDEFSKRDFSENKDEACTTEGKESNVLDDDEYFYSSEIAAFKKALDKVVSSNPPKHVIATVGVLITVIENAITKEDEKFRTIRAMNPKIKHYVMDTKGSLDVLTSVGFSVQYDEGHGGTVLRAEDLLCDTPTWISNLALPSLQRIHEAVEQEKRSDANEKMRQAALKRQRESKKRNKPMSKAAASYGLGGGDHSRVFYSNGT